MNEDSLHSTALWCSEQEEVIKQLQNICLDNPLDEEAKGILKRLVDIQNELDILYKNCEQELFV